MGSEQLEEEERGGVAGAEQVGGWRVAPMGWGWVCSRVLTAGGKKQDLSPIQLTTPRRGLIYAKLESHVKTC